MNPNWTDEIERDILALFVQDPAFASMVMDELEPSHFAPAISILYSTVRGHYRQYGEMPGDAVLYDTVRSSVGVQDAQFLRPTVLALYREVKNAQYVIDRVVTFINLRNLESSIRSAEEHIVSGSYEEARAAVVSFREVGPRKMVNFFEDNEADDAVEGIPTGIPELDDYLRGGGHGRGRLGIILGGTGVGKSSLLVNIGAHDVRLGYRVLHITAEDSRKAVRGRYDCRLSGKNVSREGYTDTDVHLINSARDTGGDLNICEMISGRCTPSSVRAHIQSLGLNKPDVVIVDHIDTMRADRHRDEKRFEHEDIATDLRGIAQEFNCAVWTGKQGDRMSRSAEKVGAENSAESYGPMRVADVVLGLARPPDLKKMNRLDIFLDKQRDGVDGRHIACVDDRYRMLIRGMITNEELKERRRTNDVKYAVVKTDGGR